MRFRIQAILGLAVFGFATIAAIPSPAAAYSWQDFYTGLGGRWPDFSVVRYKVRTGFPSVTYYNRIEDGAGKWNAAGTTLAEPDFIYDGATTSTGNADAPCSATFNGIYWRSLDYISSGYLGYTPVCENSAGVVIRFSMSIDSTRNWYNGTGTPGVLQSDLWSATSHEFGHATGWAGHYNPFDPLCGDDANEMTMCENIYRGTVRVRTLDPTTISLFRAAY